MSTLNILILGNILINSIVIACLGLGKERSPIKAGWIVTMLMVLGMSGSICLNLWYLYLISEPGFIQDAVFMLQ